MSDTIIYTKVPVWVRDYGSAGIPDQRAISDFMECETGEAVRALQSELLAISNGRYRLENFDKIVGIKRREKFGSYEAWAKAMLLWIAAHKS